MKNQSNASVKECLLKIEMQRDRETGGDIHIYNVNGEKQKEMGKTTKDDLSFGIKCAGIDSMHTIAFVFGTVYTYCVFYEHKSLVCLRTCMRV